MKKILKFYLLLFCLGCTKEKSEQTEPELLLSKRYLAEEVDISWNNTIETVDGEETLNVNYMAINFYNSEALNKIKDNEKLFERECEKIARFFIDSIIVEPENDYSEIRINAIDHLDLYFFSKKNTETMTYQVSDKE